VVTANFKETQIDRCASASRRVEVDAYGGADVQRQGGEHCRGHRSRFSLLPPDNATGNFVKVVQRVPVKIVLDASQDPSTLLRPGMSVTPTVTPVSEGVRRRDDTPVNPWIVAIAVMFATFMEVLDTTVVNVSLPHIASSMSATTEEATWALTSYLVANAIILPMTGWLAPRSAASAADAVDRRASRWRRSVRPGAEPGVARHLPHHPGRHRRRAAAAVAGGAARIVQARGARRAMGFWGLGVVVAPIWVPSSGGWLTENYSWRWVFYINLPSVSRRS
jgi:hypothetical protein